MIIGLILLAKLGLVLIVPTLLKKLGLHPGYEGQEYHLNGKKALIITTSHGVLRKDKNAWGLPTGVFGSEMTVPYYEFLDAEMDVDLASIEGGKIPIDPLSFFYGVSTAADKRYLKDPIFREKVKNSMSIASLDMTQYDAIFLAGGWGAAYDLGTSVVLAEKMSHAYLAETPIIGAVCHGVLGLIQAKDDSGELIISGRRMTGVTNKQIKELLIRGTPLHPESELKKAGVLFESQKAVLDLFANFVVVDDGNRFVTGQNQNAGSEVSQKMMSILANREKT